MKRGVVKMCRKCMPRKTGTAKPYVAKMKRCAQCIDCLKPK